jgi:hypothetical protein
MYTTAPLWDSKAPIRYARSIRLSLAPVGPFGPCQQPVYPRNMTAGVMKPRWTPCKHSQTTIHVAANLLATAFSSILSSRTTSQPECVGLSSRLHVSAVLLPLSAGCANIAQCLLSAFYPGRNANPVRSPTIAPEGCCRSSPLNPSATTTKQRYDHRQRKMTMRWQRQRRVMQKTTACEPISTAVCNSAYAAALWSLTIR